MYHKNNDNSYEINKIMLQSHATHLDDIHNNQITNTYITPDGTLSQQWMERHTLHDGFFPIADKENSYRTPNNG